MLLKLAQLFFGSLLLLFTYCLLTAFQSQEKNSSSDDFNIQKDTLVARQLLDKATSLKDKGDYRNALEALEQAQTLYTKHKLWKPAIEAVISLATLADTFQDADLKIKYGTLALNLAQQYLPKKHPLLPAAFRQKAESLMMIGELDSANYFFYQAIPLFKTHQDWTELSWSYILLAVNYLHQYELDSCQKYLQTPQALLHQQAFTEKDSTELQSTLLSLFGVLYELQGDYDKAIQNTKQAIALVLQQKAESIDSSALSTHFNNLGVFYLSKGDYQRALDNLMQALHAYKGAAKDPILLTHIGIVWSKQKRGLEAIKYYKKSLTLEDAFENPLEAKTNTLQSLVASFRDIGLYDSAVYYCQQAIKLPTTYRKPASWGQMGSLYIAKQKPQKALEYLSTAENTYLQDSTASQHSPFVLSSIYRLMADVYFLKKDPNTALNFYQKSLIANHSDFTDSLNVETNPPITGIYEPEYFFRAMRGKAKTLATFTEQPSKMEAALASYQLLLQWMDTLQASHATEAATLDWSEDFKQVYEEAITAAYQGYQLTQNTTYLNQAFTFSEKSKNAILLESLKATEGKSYAGIPDSLLQKEKDLNLDIAFYEKSLQNAVTAKEAAKEKLYQQYLSKKRLELVALREDLEQNFPKFNTWKYGGKTTTIAQVQAKLTNTQTAFIEYFVGDSVAYAFVVSQNSADFLKLNAPVQLQKSANEFRQVLLDPNAFQQNPKEAFTTYHQKANRLYQVILEPVLAILLPDIEQLIIVPDGCLNAIPFEALTKKTDIAATMDFAKLPYLLYDFGVHYAYSADLLLKNQSRQDQLPINATCLAFAPSYEGNWNFAQRGSRHQVRNESGQLIGTAHEIQQIAHFFKGQFDIGNTATERQFKQLAHEFGILHLAMHGVADFDNANFNHLKFANTTADTTEDNLLHHYEIANMDLVAQLAVLSACETGVGKYEKGEGVFSLARSFMYAGVPSVVMSLWKVSDASTSELMPYFYENLSNGQSKTTALYEAKKRFLKATDLEYRHPFYWSSFVLLGDAQTIKKSKMSLAWGGLGIVLLGLLGFLFFRRKKATQAAKMGAISG